jgi:hypothetical protein
LRFRLPLATKLLPLRGLLKEDFYKK